MSVCPVFRGERRGAGVEARVFHFIAGEGPKAVEVWSFLKLLEDFRDFTDEVTHFIAKITVRIYFWAGRWEQSL